jgi:hypothetical protein
MSGFWIINIAQGFSFFLIIKAVWEMRMTAISDFDDALHKRAHIAALGAIAAYNAFDIFSYAWFPMIYNGIADYTVGFFNLGALNVVWLFIIDHFRQERQGDIHKSDWRELFKF